MVGNLAAAKRFCSSYGEVCFIGCVTDNFGINPGCICGIVLANLERVIDFSDSPALLGNYFCRVSSDLFRCECNS